MPSPRVAGLTRLLRQPSVFIFTSPPILYTPFLHSRQLRWRAKDRRNRRPIDVQGRSRSQEDEEEEDLDEENEDLDEDEDLGDNDKNDLGNAIPKDFNEADFQRFLSEQDDTFEQPVAKRRKKDRLRQAAKADVPPSEEEDGISYFEQEAGNLDSERRRITNPGDAFGRGFSAEDERAIDEDSEELEEGLDEIDKEPYIPEDPDEDADRKALGIFSDEQIEQFQDSFMEGLKEYEPGGLQEFGKLPHHVYTTDKVSPSAELFLNKLNDALDKLSLNVENGESDHDIPKNLWRYYERSKIYIPNVVNLLPDEAWKLLWLSQAEESPNNPFRATHLKTLSEDMAKAGKILTQEQRFARLEGLFWEGKRKEALLQWEEGLKKGDAGSADYLELGIRMYAYDQNLVRAEELVDVLFKLHKNYDPRILLQVISASIGQSTEEGYERAFKLYQRLREVLTTNIKMEDFDTISLDFLRFGQKDYALAVFRDMMIIGEQRKSASGIWDAFSRFMSSGSDPIEVNALGLESLKYLPRQFQNKWFYASWMRKLIAMGQNEPAAQVMELMYERGIKPDAMHVNGLINSWLRTSSRPSHRTAERFAWAMIQERLNFVAQRRKELHSTLYSPARSIHDLEPTHPPAEKPIIPNLDRTRRVPPATIETFSVLVQWYLRRSLFANVSHLRNLLIAAELPMNSFFMNHLLYAELRHRDHRHVWTRFEAMTAEGVPPDIETWTCLWDCCKQHVDPSTNRDQRGFPRPRELLSSMRNWFDGLQGQQRRDALTDLDIDGYNDIIRAFCLSRDPAGSFIALIALRDMFGLYPEERTMRMLVMQISRLALYKPRTPKFARRITASEFGRANVLQTSQVLDMILRYRAQGYKEVGIEVDVKTLGEEKMREERLRGALQLIYTSLKQFQRPQGAPMVGQKTGIPRPVVKSKKKRNRTFDESGEVMDLDDEDEEDEDDEMEEEEEEESPDEGPDDGADDIDVSPALRQAASDIGIEIGDIEESMGLVV